MDLDFIYVELGCVCFLLFFQLLLSLHCPQMHANQVLSLDQCDALMFCLLLLEDSKVMPLWLYLGYNAASDKVNFTLVVFFPINFADEKTFTFTKDVVNSGMQPF